MHFYKISNLQSKATRMSLLQKHANFVALLVLCSITISMACNSSPRRKAPAFTCNTNCRNYNQTVCDNFISVAARQSFFLKRALETESVAQRQYASSSDSVWNQTSANLIREIWVAENRPNQTVHCNIKVTKPGLNCIAYVKLLECGIGRIQVAYGSPTSCLQDWQHRQWSKVVGIIGDLATGLDSMYGPGSSLSPRKSHWKNVKSNLAVLKKTLQYVRVTSDSCVGCSAPLPGLEAANPNIEDEVGAWSAEDYY